VANTLHACRADAHNCKEHPKLLHGACGECTTKTTSAWSTLQLAQLEMSQHAIRCSATRWQCAFARAYTVQHASRCPRHALYTKTQQATLYGLLCMHKHSIIHPADALEHLPCNPDQCVSTAMLVRDIADVCLLCCGT
jgi:hypothetical protein